MADNAVALNPLLSGITLNEITEQAIQVYKDTYRLLIRNAFQSGFVAGEAPPENREQEYFQLVMQYQRNVQVALDEAALPGDRIRAQDEIRRMIKLEQEMGRA